MMTIRKAFRLSVMTSVLKLSTTFAQVFSWTMSQCDVAVLEKVKGQFLLKDQCREYMDRGDALEHWSYLDYFLGTYDGKILKEKVSTRGQPANTRVPYRGNGTRPGRCRVLRSTGHETMPYFPGAWFPKRNDNDENGLFHASMLALLKPWRSVRDLKRDNQNFRDAFNTFQLHASPASLSIIENVQFYHECADSAKDHYNATHDDSDPNVSNANGNDDDEEIIPEFVEDEHSDIVQSFISDEDVEKAIDCPFSARELLNADVAIAIGQESGAFVVEEFELACNHPAYPATVEDLERFDAWELSVSKIDDEKKEPDPSIQVDSPTRRSLPTPASSSNTDPTVIPVRSERNDEDTSTLNEKQLMAHDIITTHLRSHLKGLCPPQRLVIVHGQGGTGKTALLNAIAHTFEKLGASSLLAKTAMSGVAASIVGGVTLHSWAGLPIICPTTNKWVTHPSKVMAARRRINMASTLWLTIDEKSMLNLFQLAQLSQVMSIVRTGFFSVEPSIPFGGINVALLGDFHQFPPIANSKNVLYNPSPDIHNAQIGRTLFEQFETVIHLDEQMRITDPLWNSILTRARTGECTANDLAEIDLLVLENKDCIHPDFTTSPWSDYVLVTSRNAVQTMWNRRMLESHCRQTGYTRYIVDATDSIDGNVLTAPQKLAIAHFDLDDTKRLPGRVEMAIGMKVMILTNIAPRAGLANGSRGSISDIILDPREPFDPFPQSTRRLLYPPSAILFSPLIHPTIQLHGLPPSTLPIFPLTNKFKLGTKTITRTQYSLTPAYAFTDYKAQGQTMESVIVDLGKPPTGALTGFTVYVALSRSRGRPNIRLLRPFDHSLFTVHPSENLRLEDIRLRSLEESTIEHYQRGDYSARILRNTTL